MEFESFQKIIRIKGPVIVTEKIDGTNAQIAIGADGDFKVGSRNRWVTPNTCIDGKERNTDNYGFAAWAYAHKDELMSLGPGRHYGAWWGAGIQRGYGRSGIDRTFSLFNVNRWRNNAALPACCSVVPVLYEGTLDDLCIEWIMDDLRTNGSIAAPGFMNPEGIVIRLPGCDTLYKHTFDGDVSKWQLGSLPT